MMLALDVASTDVSQTAKELMEMQQQGVLLAELGAALAAFVAGADAAEINIAATTGQNAAENNMFMLIPIAILFLKAIDLALTASEYKGLYDAYSAAESEEAKRDVLKTHFGESLTDAAIEEIITRMLPGGSTVKTMIEMLAEKGVLSTDSANKIVEQIKKTEVEHPNNTPNVMIGYKETPNGTVISDQVQMSGEKVDEVLALDKGARPNPDTYLPGEYINEHKSQFEDGVVRFTDGSLPNIGPPGGTFVIPYSEFEAAKIKTGGDLGLMEVELSLGEGTLTNNPNTVAYYIPSEMVNNLRMPSGNEAGANPQWRPGGYTLENVAEAVIDTIPAADLDILDF